MAEMPEKNPFLVCIIKCNTHRHTLILVLNINIVMSLRFFLLNLIEIMKCIVHHVLFICPFFFNLYTYLLPIIYIHKSQIN